MILLLFLEPLYDVTLKLDGLDIPTRTVGAFLQNPGNLPVEFFWGVFPFSLTITFQVRPNSAQRRAGQEQGQNRTRTRAGMGRMSLCPKESPELIQYAIPIQKKKKKKKGKSN